MKTQPQLTEHYTYNFILGSSATIFYNQCREMCSHGQYNDRRGLITICGKAVTIPAWLPHKPVKSEYKNVENTTL